MMRLSWFTSLLLLLAATARATPPDDAEFKQHYANAMRLYNAEQYADAVGEFQAAYKIRPLPRLLFNLGQASRRQGNAKEALRFYLVYQATEPERKPGLDAELQGYITQMKGIVERAELAQKAESNAGRLSEPVVSPAPIAATEKAQPESGSGLTLTEAAPKKPVYKKAWFWGVVGGTAAAVLIVGLSVGLSQSRSDGPSWSPRFGQ